MDKFKRLFKERFDRDLSDKDALRKALYLLEICKAIYGDTSLRSLDDKKENIIKDKKNSLFIDQKRD